MTMCLICGNATSFFLEKDGYEYQKCPACGLVFVHPQPKAEHLHHEVYSEKAGYQKHKKKDLSIIKETPHIKKILDYLESDLFLYSQEQQNSSCSVRDVHNVCVSPRLLDVGCSSGEFLYAAKKRGFETYGVELNSLTANIAEANGLNVKIGTLEDAHFENDIFDAVFLGDIIEHVPNPRALLIECERILKQGGVLIISTPNLDSFWAKATFKLYAWFTIPWSVLTPPHHLFQFSESNLKKLLKEFGFNTSVLWFRRPPKLTYELGSLHVWGKFKRKKNIKNLLFLMFSFSFYTVLYALDVLITSLKKKDFGMIMVFQK